MVADKISTTDIQSIGKYGILEVKPLNYKACMSAVALLYSQCDVLRESNGVCVCFRIFHCQEVSHDEILRSDVEFFGFCLFLLGYFHIFLFFFVVLNKSCTFAAASLEVSVCYGTSPPQRESEGSLLLLE